MLTPKSRQFRESWQDRDETLRGSNHLASLSKAFMNNLPNFLNFLRELGNDKTITHLDLSSNLSQREVSSATSMIELFQAFNQTFTRNKRIISLNLANNHLFEYSAHPTNSHVNNYAEDFVDILLKSSIEQIDISGNAITGPSRRMLKGLSKLMKEYYCKKGKVFICQHSGLHGLAYKSIACGLGPYSTLTHLGKACHSSSFDLDVTDRS
jgi:hypothetical protein